MSLCKNLSSVSIVVSIDWNAFVTSSPVFLSNGTAQAFFAENIYESDIRVIVIRNSLFVRSTWYRLLNADSLGKCFVWQKNVFRNCLCRV